MTWSHLDLIIGLVVGFVLGLSLMAMLSYNRAREDEAKIQELLDQLGGEK